MSPLVGGTTGCSPCLGISMTNTSQLQAATGVDGARWPLRTSNPLCLVTSGVGGFDSLALPPTFSYLELASTLSSRVEQVFNLLLMSRKWSRSLADSIAVHYAPLGTPAGLLFSQTMARCCPVPMGVKQSMTNFEGKIHGWRRYKTPTAA